MKRYSGHTFKVYRLKTLDPWNKKGDLVGEHKTYAAAEKRVRRLVSMSNGRMNAADFEIREENPRVEKVSARTRNPRLQNMFVLYATRGKTVLKYIGGVRFSSHGRAVLFPSRREATMAARDLKYRFAQALRGYTLRVHS